MPKDIYRVSPDGGYYEIKNGAIVGWIPPDHPKAAAIVEQESKGVVIIEPEQPPVVKPPQDPEPTLKQVIALLVRKGVVTKKEVDDEAAAK